MHTIQSQELLPANPTLSDPELAIDGPTTGGDVSHHESLEQLEAQYRELLLRIASCYQGRLRLLSSHQNLQQCLASAQPQEAAPFPHGAEMAHDGGQAHNAPVDDEVLSPASITKETSTT
jgi:hypothetical protein